MHEIPFSLPAPILTVQDPLARRCVVLACVNRTFCVLAKPCQVFLCFSLIRNTRKIFNTDVPATAVTSINGVRVISMWWIVLGHVFLIALGATDTTLRMYDGHCSYFLTSVFSVIKNQQL